MGQILDEMQSPDWFSVVGTFVATIIGAFIALVGTYALWRIEAHARYRADLAAAIAQLYRGISMSIRALDTTTDEEYDPTHWTRVHDAELFVDFGVVQMLARGAQAKQISALKPIVEELVVANRANRIRYLVVIKGFLEDWSAKGMKGSYSTPWHQPKSR
ncbi:hypothetical protein ACFVAJ_11070 [Agromyces sp. NPDC057679]|uniref:hypothetical protein n=1 Tax=Agromyces sp. NPDC057679 TaxID=3346207 RepID=UPI0036712568